MAQDVQRLGAAEHLSAAEVRQRCRDLAAGELNRSEIARKYGVNPSTITRFARRHAAEIEAIRRDLDDEFAGLWIARKENRLAAYQDEIARLDAHPSASHHEWSKARQSALHAAAEELGQLPGRGAVVIMPVEHVVIGVDVDVLR